MRAACWALMLTAAVRAAEPIDADDLRLLLGMRVPPAQIAALTGSRCVSAPMTTAYAQELVKLGATAELIGVLAVAQCKPAPPKPELVIEKCPEAYTADPAGKGCIDFQRGPAYAAAPPEKQGRCSMDVLVDGVTDFVLRGTLLMYEVESGSAPGNLQSTCSQPFPRREVRPSLAKHLGRGTAVLMAQPSEANSYALRIRVTDDQRGRDRYRLQVDWVNP